MKVLHLAAGNRWTGAAAPAFAEVEALRGAGVDAHYAYVGGYKLESRLSHHDFAHPLIQKAQNPFAFRRTIEALDRLVRHHGFDYIHAHLTYDHWLARFVARDRRVNVARTFHSRRTLRNDVFTSMLVRRTQRLFVVNDTFRSVPLIRDRAAVFTPPPVDHRQFSAAGPNARPMYGIAPETRLLCVIGKLAPDRGFELALHTFARVRRLLAGSKMMIVGHGDHRAVLEKLAGELSIADDLIWAGYHEDDLAAHYRAANLLLFTAAGSDEGHRAITEAMACGVPPATYPVPGLQALLGELAGRLIARAGDPDALASRIVGIFAEPPLTAEVERRSHAFDYATSAGRLIDAYSAPM